MAATGSVPAMVPAYFLSFCHSCQDGSFVSPGRRLLLKETAEKVTKESAEEKE